MIDFGRFILNIFSSSELALMYLLIAAGLILQNTYSLYLFLAMVLKIFLLYYPKKLTQHSQLGKRPQGAFDCNMFSCGGKPKRGGLISGHMTNIGMLSTVLGLNLYFQDSFTPKHVEIIAFLLLTTGAARYLTKCHSLLQIILGIIIGTLFGIGLFILQKPLLKNKTFKSHYEQVMSNFN